MEAEGRLIGGLGVETPGISPILTYLCQPLGWKGAQKTGQVSSVTEAFYCDL